MAGAAFFCSHAWSHGFNEQKANLIREGVTPTLLYDGSIASDTAGGTRTGTAYVGNLRLQLVMDGKQLASVIDSSHTHGMIGLGTGWNRGQFDNLSVSKN